MIVLLPFPGLDSGLVIVGLPAYPPVPRAPVPRAPVPLGGTW